MFKFLLIPVITLLSLVHYSANPTTEIDAFWETLSKTVSEGDFEGYAALYAEDAILVNAISENTMLISEALENWKPAFMDTKSGKNTSAVEFRFSQRMHDTLSAHETGIFRYTSQRPGQQPETSYIHFESLFVKKNGAWKLLMEYQISVATVEEWEALAEE